MKTFQQMQYQFARHLRDPDTHPAIESIDDRRMGIYRDLIYNNIEGFISGAFPILRSIMLDEPWHQMVRHFIANHPSQTPYFLEISQEFLHYLMQGREPQPGDPVFMLELAHYEWAELALDVAVETIPAADATHLSVLDGHPQVSPLVWCLSYHFPVHRIGPRYQPTEAPAEPSFLVVYRNRLDEVKFLESNPVTVRLIQILQESRMTGTEALRRLADDMQHPHPEALERDGKQLLENLLTLDIIAAVLPPGGMDDPV